MFFRAFSLGFQHTAARRRLHDRHAAHRRRQRFNTQPPEGGCLKRVIAIHSKARFNTQPPEGGCQYFGFFETCFCQFQHTAARRRLRFVPVRFLLQFCVSTHSRPKAAAYVRYSNFVSAAKFQHTAARRRLPWAYTELPEIEKVSTHSRPKAAAPLPCCRPCSTAFQHTAARRRLRPMFAHKALFYRVSTHSRPKAAAPSVFGQNYPRKFQHTAARRRLLPPFLTARRKVEFQHTAARRRLQYTCDMALRDWIVSTHSRPKAAAALLQPYPAGGARFNTQPPEGGCSAVAQNIDSLPKVSTHSRPKAAAYGRQRILRPNQSFNTQPPEGGCLWKTKDITP